MIVVITPTGERPEAWANCIKYMKKQDYKGPVKWIIVDDGRTPSAVPEVENWKISVIRPEPFWKPGQNTQARNLLEGLKMVDFDNDKVVIVEDDDCYASWWISRCVGWLETHDLVGEAPSLYRHLDGTEKMMNNRDHASLCSTAMKGSALHTFKKILSKYQNAIDINLWRYQKCGSKKIYPFSHGVIGIKGYPGRPGIGMGHNISKIKT